VSRVFRALELHLRPRDPADTRRKALDRAQVFGSFHGSSIVKLTWTTQPSGN
jgi:hypothetical protein